MQFSHWTHQRVGYVKFQSPLLQNQKSPRFQSNSCNQSKGGECYTNSAPTQSSRESLFSSSFLVSLSTGYSVWNQLSTCAFAAVKRESVQSVAHRPNGSCDQELPAAMKPSPIHYRNLCSSAGAKAVQGLGVPLGCPASSTSRRLVSNMFSFQKNTQSLAL